jgi:hypothetical protein
MFHEAKRLAKRMVVLFNNCHPRACGPTRISLTLTAYINNNNGTAGFALKARKENVCLDE